MNRKVWAILVVAVLVICPVAVATVFCEAGTDIAENEIVFDPDGGDGNTPDGVDGNDPEHPQ